MCHIYDRYIKMKKVSINVQHGSFTANLKYALNVIKTNESVKFYLKNKRRFEIYTYT